MVPSADDKKYALDTRLFQDAVVQDGIFKNFETSPLMDGVLMKDVCIYGAGTVNPNLPQGTVVDPLNPAHWLVMPDVNKLGKVSQRTSWDSFSYAIQMGHNVYAHINAVQRANQEYDKGNVPAMLVQEKFDRLYFKDVVEAIFATSDRGTADKLVEDYSKFWMSIIGTRGATGKKTVNASTHFANLFDEVDAEPVQLEHGEEFTEEESNKLDQLENEVKK
jgi:hypothetical protein